MLFVNDPNQRGKTEKLEVEKTKSVFYLQPLEIKMSAWCPNTTKHFSIFFYKQDILLHKFQYSPQNQKISIDAMMYYYQISGPISSIVSIMLIIAKIINSWSHITFSKKFFFIILKFGRAPQCFLDFLYFDVFDCFC